MHHRRQGSEPQKRESLITSEVEPGGAGSGTLGDEHRPHSGRRTTEELGVLSATRGNRLRRFTSLHPFGSPLCGQSFGAPSSLAFWVSPQDTALPSKGQAPLALTRKIKELCVENARLPSRELEAKCVKKDPFSLEK